MSRSITKTGETKLKNWFQWSMIQGRLFLVKWLKKQQWPISSRVAIENKLSLESSSAKH